MEDGRAKMMDGKENGDEEDRGKLWISHPLVHTAALWDFIGPAPKPLSQAAKRNLKKHL